MGNTHNFLLLFSENFSKNFSENPDINIQTLLLYRIHRKLFYFLAKNYILNKLYVEFQLVVNRWRVSVAQSIMWGEGHYPGGGPGDVVHRSRDCSSVGRLRTSNPRAQLFFLIDCTLTFPTCASSLWHLTALPGFTRKVPQYIVENSRYKQKKKMFFNYT